MVGIWCQCAAEKDGWDMFSVISAFTSSAGFKLTYEILKLFFGARVKN